MKSNDFISDFYVFDTTFEDCLQNLSFILKWCVEINLKLTWIKYQQERMMSHYIIPKRRIRVDISKDKTIFKPPPPLSAQHTQSFPHHQSSSNDIHKLWSSMFALCTLGIKKNPHKKLYEIFFAIMIRPPDWSCLFTSWGMYISYISVSLPHQRRANDVKQMRFLGGNPSMVDWPK